MIDKANGIHSKVWFLQMKVEIMSLAKKERI